MRAGLLLMFGYREQHISDAPHEYMYSNHLAKGPSVNADASGVAGGPFILYRICHRRNAIRDRVSEFKKLGGSCQRPARPRDYSIG